MRLYLPALKISFQKFSLVSKFEKPSPGKIHKNDFLGIYIWRLIEMCCSLLIKYMQTFLSLILIYINKEVFIINLMYFLKSIIITKAPSDYFI